MIVVDTSVWIAHFRNEASPGVARLRAIADPSLIVVGDLVLLECLQGARDGRHAARIEHALSQFRIEPMLDRGLAIAAAESYRLLRAAGRMPRKTIDLIIATFCIRHGWPLLHQNRDFQPMVVGLGLSEA